MIPPKQERGVIDEQLLASLNVTRRHEIVVCAVGPHDVDQIDDILGGRIHEGRRIQRRHHDHAEHIVHLAVVRPYLQHLAGELARDVDEEHAELFGCRELGLIGVGPHARAVGYEVLGEDAAVHGGVQVDVGGDVEGIAVDGTRQRGVALAHDFVVDASQVHPVVVRRDLVLVLFVLAIAAEGVVEVALRAVRSIDHDLVELRFIPFALR
mmetsp:Transcript_18894/g.52522  ORF Transcript_18894/g.52522 Transcript_18894/m.52522 type:complete len:210 (+) Transcript_18894:643-1272(+)